MNITMDNHAGNSTKWAWLAGIWDGEGTFQIYYYKQKTGKNSYVGRLTLTNTCIVMINEIVKLLDFIGVAGHIFEESPRKKGHKLKYHITINKIAHVKKATEMMLPYLISKKPHAELLIRFLNSRLKYKPQCKQDERGRIMGIVYQGYSDEEKSLYDQLRELNRRGESSETIRQTSTNGR